ncbi:amino acid adenylation domain-containing protein [Archangium violaceum]|uniref:non-ribosomal peptide synthetase/type I polyketide synthase n=1 Tax=Archangium violaceum TaxID=83451 RepID=UPI00194EA9B7|nr:non-ribosomal peptide synthetase/type I polyketide synthase [Archangium violaceum]QRN93140.1 amino acid adenylation domain-containing protein [Archangium violaceum]
MAEQQMDEGTGNDIAIIGMAGRFPGAGDVRAFWRNLREGVESISRFRPDELEPSPLVPEALRGHPDFVRAGGVLEGAELFDNGFFDISPREALWMDPQQRLFLECSWAALEDAAYDPERFAGKISLYAGVGQNGHMLSLLGHVKKEPAALFEALGTSGENAATKVSFKLRLRGESLAVYTACSTGLVSVHMACQSLLMRQSDIALAGAVRVSLPQRTGYLYQEGMIFSPDGHCRAFDARARGTVSGNGVGVVVLKPLADALRDGDHVYAVIKGSAINNDGHLKVGYTAPSVEGQSDVISEALAYAGVQAGDIGYVEAHGTGTPLGDPIEVAALTRAYRRDTDGRGFCGIGSVKSNIGHLDTAAGIAGLLKATLALHNEELPPSLHFERPNPALGLESSPFFVVTGRREWKRGETPRLAAVSSFGIGGTNAHAILGEAPLVESQPSARPHQLVTLSARTPEALEAMTRELAAHLEARPGVDLADLAFTRAVGRKSFEHRRALVAADTAGLIARLKAPPAIRSLASLEAAREQRVAFLFPGQGAQSVGMARELYASEPVFREHADACFTLLAPRLGRDLRPLLYPAPGQEVAAREALADPRFALPALFIVEYALARLWMDWGIEPHAMLGHSYGEYAAACLAGVLSLEDALTLAVTRGRLMASMPPGAMTAVGCSEADLRPLLTGGLSLAAVNGASRCVVSGPVAEVERLEQELVRRDVGVLRLPARHAFHSADVEPVMPELQRVVAGLRLSAPQRPYVSSLTGTWIRPEEATDPSYWVRQMRQPVRFSEGLDTLLRDGGLVLLEVGPDQALTALARLRLRGEEGSLAVPSLPRAGVSASDHGALLESVGSLWRAGLEIRWDRFYAHERRLRVPLPTYPFERQRFVLESRWLEQEAPRQEAPSPVSKPVPAPVPSSRPAPSAVAGAGAPGPRNDIERQVMEIWRERLGIADFGIHDNFLELGGNSLMAAQMLTRLRETFPVQLPLSDLFEAPTVAGVASRIEARLKDEAPGTGRVPVSPLVPIPREGVLPLSFVQERVCALERFVPGNPALYMPVALRLTGSLDVAVLERSLGEVIRRHEALRTTYATVDGRTVLRVTPALKPSLSVTVLEGSREQREAEALRLAREEAARPFSLERGPVIRTSLVRIDSDVHLLLATLHHVVSDTLSMVALVRELSALYAAFLQGQPSPLPALSVQYMDYAAWQRRALASGAFSDQESYWRERMAQPPGPLALPLDRPREAVRKLLGTRRPFGFSRALTDAIHALGQREGFTDFMILLAAYKALLARYAGQDDIVVGTPIGNRTRVELEPLIGYVAHAVPLRTDLSGDPTFLELLSRVRDTTLGAYANPDVPYEHLVRELEPGKDPERARLFDAVFVLHAGFASSLELPALRLELVEVPDAPAQFGATLSHLSIFMSEGPHGYEGHLEYAAELFEPPTVERLLHHLQALLESALANPGQRLSELSLLTAAERSQLATARVDAPRAEVIPVLASLEAQASRTPEALAVSAGERGLSWRELRERARHLAGLLVQKGVGAEQLVAVCLEPSPERLVALWAVLEAGAAWVLLPPARLRELASFSPEGSPPPLLLTYSRLRTSLALDASRVLHVDALPEGSLPSPVERRSAPDVESMVCLEPLAGSTGAPLQAIHTQGTVAHLFRALDEGHGATPGGAWLWAEEPGAHGSGLEVLWALSRGLRVVLAPEPERARFLSVGQGTPARRPLAFGLSYFANDEDGLGRRKYQLLLDGARFADAHGFSAVWTPERHFHSFGGLYPSPAITGAGLATITEKIGIRAGSVVLPLHDPIQVAEEWAMIDNLSGGRVGVSFASGWHANDFVFAPDNYARRKEVLHRGIELVRHLWRGGTVRRRNGEGQEVELTIRPRPVQTELPFWLTAAGSPDTFRLAGELGANVLTNLMGQQLDSLAEKVALYRETWRQHGHAGRGHVSLMMHAFLGSDAAEARRTVREPLLRYFRSSVDILSGFAASQGLKVDPRTLTPRDMEALLEHGLERYMEDGGLFGTPESSAPMVERVKRLDVDEVACLVDFGIGTEATLVSLQHLDTLRRRSQPEEGASTPTVLHESGTDAEALLALVREAGVTHLHCTPTLARALVGLPGVAEALRPVRRLFIEGGAPELAVSLARAAGVEVVRREETLGPGTWLPVRPERTAHTQVLAAPPSHVRLHVLDSRGQPVPVGVAGELALGGGGVPRGFWMAPEATRSRLVPHPSEAGARLLTTGRRARLLADGSVELLSVGSAPARRPAPAAQAPRPEVARRPEGPPAIARVPRDRPLPLSFGQQRLWYLDQLEPGNVAYNNPSALRLSGRLDTAALERALNEVVRRHEALRTTFALEDSGPVQRIVPSLTVPLERARLEAAGDRDAEIARWAREEARRPFDLAAGPLMHAALLQIEDTEHVLLVTPHHIVSDGWSAGVMMKELAILYAAYVTGAESPLPELTVQYADYAAWQHQWMRGPALESELSWWKETLAEVPVLRIPTDRPRPAVQGYRGAQHCFTVPRRVADALGALAKREGATPFMALMAAYQVLLFRYSGQEDFAVGTAVAGRNRPELEPLIGCFINSLPLRAGLSGDPSFVELLGRVRRTALDAFAHQEAPFEKLVDALHVSRDLGHSPIFQTLLVLHNVPMPTVQLAGLTLSGMDAHSGASRLDLALELRETADGLWGGLEYNTDLFDPETIARMGEQFVRLLEGIVSAPERRLSSLSLLSEAERQRLLVEWNPPAAPRDSATVLELFEAQVARTPDAPALADAGDVLSYRELSARASRIASWLRRRGVGPEHVVALALERPSDVVPSILGTLAAGGAWLPLDPSHPRERLRLLMEDAGARVMLDRQLLLEAVASEPDASPASRPEPHHAAYVLFTSGSTGKPKGVVVEHRQLVHATRARFEVYGAPAVSLSLSPFTFDASLAGLFWTLLHGGTLRFPDAGVMDDPRELAASLAKHGVTHLICVPVLYAQILAAAPAGGLSSLRAVSVGGEAPPKDLIRAHHEALPNTPLFNEYGPTEATIWSTAHRVSATETGPVPIGRAIPGARVYVLDERFQPVPVGVPGELFIGGAGVARGYLGRPELTSERFLGDPFDTTPGARLYRTGDRVRWRKDGVLEFLGRQDGQVKVRGFRIETGEVEAALAAHPGLREVAVAAREDGRGGRRLVGYVVPHQNPGPGADALRAFLRERLPEYMVPSAFVEREALPRTRTGKVDLGALPAPEAQASVRSAAYVAPRNEQEEQLARIWCEVLGVERVGVDDNFFELGGDSILSIQIVTRAGRAGIELSPRQVFQNPTVARLAAVANTRLAVKAEQGPVTGPVALTPIERWFFAQAPAEPHHWNMSLFLEVRTTLDAAVLERALGHVVEHHDALRLRFARGEDGWRQACAAPGEPVRLERVDLSGVPAGEQAAELERRASEVQGSLRLEEGSLLRAVLFDLGAGRSGRLLLVLHHLLVDGVSWRILLEDLLAAYQRLAAGAPVGLPPKTTSFQAWARGLSEHALSKALEAERSWWLERPWTRVTRLPVDQPGGGNTEGTARSVTASLSVEETRALLQDVPRAYHTQINDALLTALARTVGRWAGNPLVLVDVEGHGREELLAGLDVSRTVGWFTTYYPALVDLRDAAGPGEALRAVKEQLRAVPSKGMGYGLLRHLREDSGLAALPAAELSFNYLGQVDGALAGSGMLTLAPEGMGLQRGPRNRRPYLLDVMGAVVGGQLQVTWTYGEALHRRETVERLAADFLERLRELIAHCQSPEVGGHTPSDFPLAKVKQNQLDKLSARFGKKTR